MLPGINIIRSTVFFLVVIITQGCRNTSSKEFTEEKLDTNRLVKVKLASDLDEPMEIAITHDGRIIIVERKGAVKLYLPGNNIVKQISQIPVYTGQEDGLLGVTIDPGYAKNNFIYFYYSPAGNNPVQRVSRFTLVKDTLSLTSEKILLEIPTQREECCHSAGSLAFGPDANLFIAVGDNTNPHNPGYYNSIDERKGREYWDAQRTASNTNDLRGKILRIHPEPDGSYTIPEGNLFPKNTPGARPEIYVMGCRNPYRIGIDLKKGWVYWGDVGQNTIDDPKRGPVSYDEWHLATGPGFFGWPYFAGPNAAYADFDFQTETIGPFFDPRKPENSSVNNTGLKDLPPAKGALIWYSYDESKTFPHLGTGGKSPIGGPVFYSDLYKDRINDTTRHLHSHFNNKVFIAEWMRDWINVLTVNDSGRLETIEPFMRSTRFNHPIDLEFGPDGVLYVLDYGTYWFAKNKDAGLYRIEYQRGNRSPIAKLDADKNAGTLPLTVRFSSQGTFDPDSSNLTYRWYFDKKEVQSTDTAPEYTFTKPGLYNVKLVVTDDEGKSGEKMIEIKAGNSEPEVFFNVTNGNKSFYWEGIPVEYEIDIADKEDGSLRNGQISPNDVKVTLAYSTMGTDLSIVSRSHESVTAAEPDLYLIKNSDCKSCHAMDEKSIGPSYLAIANRYTKDSVTIKKIASKIISGGGGAWGEHAMSAHPQLSQQQAIEMSSFILSLKNDASIARTVPAKGKFVPAAQPVDGAAGEYIFSVSYTDKRLEAVGSNSIRRNFYLRQPNIRAASSDAEKGVHKSGGSTSSFTEPGAWLLFRSIDLTMIRSLTFGVDARQKGGKLNVHVGETNGTQAASITVRKMAGPDPSKPHFQQITAQLKPSHGVHDVYIIYDEAPGKKASDSLFIDWIRFNRK